MLSILDIQDQNILLENIIYFRKYRIYYNVISANQNILEFHHCAKFKIVWFLIRKLNYFYGNLIILAVMLC